MVVKSRHQEHKELTRAAVLDTAAGQFAERGYAATTIDDVASAARVSKGTVYYHFADKAQLFEAVFRNRQARLLDTVATAVEGCRGPWERLQAGLDAHLEGRVPAAGLGSGYRRDSTPIWRVASRTRPIETSFSRHRARWVPSGADKSTRRWAFPSFGSPSQNSPAQAN